MKYFVAQIFLLPAKRTAPDWQKHLRPFYLIIQWPRGRRRVAESSYDYNSLISYWRQTTIRMHLFLLVNHCGSGQLGSYASSCVRLICFHYERTVRRIVADGSANRGQRGPSLAGNQQRAIAEDDDQFATTRLIIGN